MWHISLFQLGVRVADAGLMVFEKFIRYAGLAVGLMVFEKFIRYAGLAVGLKPSARGCEGRLRGLDRTPARGLRPHLPTGGGMGEPGSPMFTLAVCSCNCSPMDAIRASMD